LALALLGGAPTACVRAGAIPLDAARPYAPLPPDSVRVYREAAEVRGRYRELALLTLTTEYSWTDAADSVRVLRGRAARLGADGVILNGASAPRSGARRPSDGPALPDTARRGGPWRSVTSTRRPRRDEARRR
jgi:hypothetical protein